MVYGKEVEGEKELIVTCRAIPNYDKIKETYGDKTDKEIHEIIWNKIKSVFSGVGSWFGSKFRAAFPVA